MRGAVLGALLDGPLHGYAIMGRLEERSGGAWRPSPGSVYPVLQQLTDEELVQPHEVDGKRAFALTETGRAVAEAARESADLVEPDPLEQARREAGRALRAAHHAAADAVHQVARHGTPEQVRSATQALDALRRDLYRLLADDDR